MSQVSIAKLVLKIGSLCFYESTAPGIIFGGKEIYFWKFANDTRHFGPFNTLLEAGESVDAYMRDPIPDGPLTEPTDKGNIEEVKNIISVDFKNKRRLT